MDVDVAVEVWVTVLSCVSTTGTVVVVDRVDWMILVCMIVDIGTVNVCGPSSFVLDIIRILPSVFQTLAM